MRNLSRNYSSQSAARSLPSGELRAPGLGLGSGAFVGWGRCQDWAWRKGQPLAPSALGNGENHVLSLEVRSSSGGSDSPLHSAGTSGGSGMDSATSPPYLYFGGMERKRKGQAEVMSFHHLFNFCLQCQAWGLPRGWAL